MRQFCRWLGDPLDFKNKVADQAPEYIRPDSVAKLLEAVEPEAVEEYAVDNSIV